jgi:glycosyltransferase involved in cell wall biosynthesis
VTDVSCAAVLIVRDEEPVIERCLRSVRELVDEIVVLDTGSVDGTRDLARRMGARVVESGWPDDFAAARNEALSHARTDWILSIDADERLVEGRRQQLIPQAGDGSPMAYRVWLRPGASFTPFRHCRLFRNDPRIRFEGRIRESVLPSIRRIANDASNAPAVVADCDIRLEHADDPVTRTAKHARDRRLLEEAVREDPDNALYWTDLGRAHMGGGDRERALGCWERAIAIVRRHGGLSATDSLPYTDVAQQRAPHDPLRAELLDEASARWPENHLIAWLRAETLLARRDFRAAEAIARRLAALGDRSAAADLAYDRRIFGEAAYAALGTCCFQAGQWVEAACWYERAAAANPASLEHRARLALTLRRGARP